MPKCSLYLDICGAGGWGGGGIPGSTYQELALLTITQGGYDLGSVHYWRETQVPLPFNSSIFLYRARSRTAWLAMWQDGARPDVKGSGTDHFIHSCL